MDGVTLRFSEHSYYDPIDDREVVRLMATTGLGTWSIVLPLDNSKLLRQKRKEFEEYVVDHVQDLPEELELG